MERARHRVGEEDKLREDAVVLGLKLTAQKYVGSFIVSRSRSLTMATGLHYCPPTSGALAIDSLPLLFLS